MLAAGTASRYGALKQFEDLAGRTLVDRAVDVALGATSAVVAVVPPACGWTRPDIAGVVRGGPSRCASVRCGLAVVPTAVPIVVLHDAAHPLADAHLFDSVIAAVLAGADAAVPGVPVTDVLRRVDGTVMAEEIGRDGIVEVQVPQAFRADILRAVHASRPDAAEDSSLVLRRGGRVEVVTGDPWNVHVTTAAELALARKLVGDVGSTRRRPAPGSRAHD
ncbi:MAG: 2-C-methyl-D-erythritol 4-phosphate cytidylyltransferase [Nitriliruptorales bacterium]|nr:2-C-methyl-D-erythritol 4-phosphate cytidylyltransferase [Nitriliruptorales bacterium]